MPTAPFPERARFDARDKVLGRTAFAADVPLPGLLYAMTVPATIAKGRIALLSTTPALAIPGVVRVLTADDFPPPPPPTKGSQPPPPTITADIAYHGQPVALVVAETLEAAIEGAEAVRPSYTADAFVPVIDGPGAVTEPSKPVTAGDAAAVLPGLKMVVDEHYVSPAQHHNPMEMLSTTADWRGGKLTIWEGTQSAGPMRAAVAKTLRLDPAAIEVKSPYTGGAFGQKGAIQRQTAIVARAAMLIGRPVKLVMPRGQIFHNATFRPLSRHHVTVGAGVDGRIAAIRYAADHQQSQKGQFPPSYHESVPHLYGVADYDGTTANVRIDTQDPAYMRAPHPHPSHFAFESAVDELAYKIDKDPVAFRLAHRATVDPIHHQPYSSHFLNECLTQGAQRFGWDKRTMAPGSMALPDGSLVGWGVAAGAYPANTTAAIAILRVSADGSTRIAVTGHEFGQGIRTVIAQLLVRDLDINPAKLDIAIGDTADAPQHTTAGSWGTASLVPIVEKAAAAMRARLAELLAGRTPPGDIHRQLAAVRRPYPPGRGERTSRPGQDAGALDRLRAGGMAGRRTRLSQLHDLQLHRALRRGACRAAPPAASACHGSLASPIAAASSRRAPPRAKSAAAS